MRRAPRRVLLVALIVALAVAAGVAATAAYAATYYCNGCNLGSVPAVSSAASWQENHSSTFYAKKQQIYYYHVPSGTTSGSVATQVRVFGLDYYGSPSTGTATARCHLLNDGTSLADCWASQ